jgi:hypothetical protein
MGGSVGGEIAKLLYNPNIIECLTYRLQYTSTGTPWYYRRTTFSVRNDKPVLLGCAF